MTHMLELSITRAVSSRSRNALYGPRVTGSLVPAKARSASTARRKRNSLAGRPPVSVAIAPVSSTSSCCSIRRRKFCLCSQPAGQRLDRCAAAATG